MATPGQLCETVASILGKSQATVRAHHLHLARAGLRTTGGRGRSSAKMTARDASALIIASVTSPSLRESVNALTTYAALPANPGEFRRRENDEIVSKENLAKGWNLRFMPLPRLFALGDDHTFGDLLTAVIESAVVGEITLAEHQEDDIRYLYVPKGPAAQVEITMNVPRPAVRVIISANEFAERRTYHSLGSPSVAAPSVDLSAEYKITDRTLFAISQRLKDQPIQITAPRVRAKVARAKNRSA